MNGDNSPPTLNSLPNIAMVLIVAAFVIAIGAVALSSFKDDSTIYDTLSVTNNSFTATSGTYSNFLAAADGSQELISVSNIGNGSTQLSTTDYTVRKSDGTVNITNATGTYYVNYTIKGGYAYNITKAGLTGESNLSSQFGTIGTIIGIIVLLGIVVGGFYAFNNKRM